MSMLWIVGGTAVWSWFGIAHSPIRSVASLPSMARRTFARIRFTSSGAQSWRMYRIKKASPFSRATGTESKKDPDSNEMRDFAVETLNAFSVCHAVLAFSITGRRSKRTPVAASCLLRILCRRWPRDPPTSTKRENFPNGPSSTIASAPNPSIALIARPNCSSRSGRDSNKFQTPPLDSGYLAPQARSHSATLLVSGEKEAARFCHTGYMSSTWCRTNAPM
mmetsp:Transcript_17840/g.44632  ORF Transcript_17840/g.44632 Transcript_17840/m.44632 type:complete len:221 (-) Transcript_17840:1123-1785(-)